MRSLAFSAALLFGASLSAAASAQTIGIGTTKGGGFAQVATSIANIASTKGGLNARPQPMAGTQQYLPPINAGEMEFGIANIYQTIFAMTGTGYSEGQKMPNIRIAATLMPTVIGAIAPAKSSIVSIKDIKKQRMPHGFTSSVQIQTVFDAFVANAGLSWDDITKVPVVGLPQSIDLLKQGGLDVAGLPPGSGPSQEVNASIDGGIRFLDMDDSKAAVDRVQKLLPGATVAVIKPASGMVGVEKPTKMLSYDTLLVTHGKVADDVVYKMVKSLYENDAALKESGAIWREFDKSVMARQHGGHPYHPGALKFYKEIGLMK